jgi:hypothetical protein
MNMKLLLEPRILSYCERKNRMRDHGLPCRMSNQTCGKLQPIGKELLQMGQSLSMSWTSHGLYAII